MNREQAFALIGEERDHQDAKWGTVEQHPHEIPSWILLMRKYLSLAEQSWCDGKGDAANRLAVQNVMKATALGVACMEQHGCKSENRDLLDTPTEFKNPMPLGYDVYQNPGG